MRLHPDTLFGEITMNEKSFVNTAPLGGLYSGRILRAIVQSLDVQEEVLTNRTARRFFAGQHVDEHNRNQIFDALGQALITRGLAPETLEDLPETLPMASVVGMTLMMVCGEWDRLMAQIQACSGQVADVGEAVAQLLRLVVVDAALRLFALVYLDLESLPGSEPPAWVLENGTRNILRQRLRAAGLTRDHLAARLEVWPTSVDNWLDGKNRPSPEHVAALARELASREGGGDAAALGRSLNRQISLAAMADQMAAGIGRDKLIELTTKLAHFARELSQSPELPRILGDEPRGTVCNLIILGSAGGSAADLLSWLADRELDPDWRWNLLAAIRFWDPAFEAVSMQHTGQRSAAGLAQDISDVTGVVTEENRHIIETLKRKASWHADYAIAPRVGGEDPRSYLAKLQGRTALRRRLAERFPGNPLAHLQLGSFLGDLGIQFADRMLIDEGILERKIAAGLQPDWDAPAVEPGRILVNFGEREAALRELEQAERNLPEPTPHLRFVKGFVLMTLECFTEALECLEAVIEERPDFAPAYDLAAHSAFQSGDKTKGLRYAKGARMLGIYTEHRAWGSGAYSSRPKRV